MTEELLHYGLLPVSKVLSISAFLIANRNSWESKDMGEIVASVCDEVMAQEQPPSLDIAAKPEIVGQYLPKHPEKSEVSPETRSEEVVRLALPDGHQQVPALRLLSKAGIHIDDYPSAVGNRRPTTDLPGVTIKVIRPQDMPLQVANGNFDLAITGRDWLMEHLYQFPSSPVTELLDLKLGRVKIVAVVSKDSSVADVHSLRELNAERAVPLRVASEYVNIADKYARDNHLGLYQVIPTWGASEAFLPEDADLLIENTQTGRTLARHNLKIIDTLFKSTACLIGNTNRISNPIRRQRMESIIETLRMAVEEI